MAKKKHQRYLVVHQNEKESVWIQPSEAEAIRLLDNLSGHRLFRLNKLGEVIWEVMR